MKKILPLFVFLVVGVFLFLSLNSDPNKLPSPLVGKKFPIDVEEPVNLGSIF